MVEQGSSGEDGLYAEPDESLDWPPKFTIDTAHVLELFTGDRFYSSADAALREAVLNAIDACGRRDATEEPGYERSISVVFDRDAATLTIADNGDGMSQARIGALFAKIGASASHLAGSDEESQYQAVGEFGIGVVSYFLVSDTFRLHSLSADDQAVGVEFDRSMLDGVTPAKVINPEQSSVGTTLLLSLKSTDVLESLIKQFPHWVRDVPYLSAKTVPGDVPLEQGTGEEVHAIEDLELDEWIEDTNLGLPFSAFGWRSLDGRAHVDVLYRGVFVQRCDIDRLWAISGTIHVDPKVFQPKLNREGFIGPDLLGGVTRFLQKIHPRVVELAADRISELLQDEEISKWTMARWISIWLAIPREPAYAESARKWDAIFSKREAFVLLGSEGTQVSASVQDLAGLGVERLYLAATPLSSQTALIQQAVRLLRARNDPVVQGVEKDPGYLQAAAFVGTNTAPLLLERFASELPEIVPVNEGLAETILSAEALITVYSEPIPVRIVALGQDGAALAVVKGEIWLNHESGPGQALIRTICARNEGHLGLWVGCLEHAPNLAQQVANLLKSVAGETSLLGPVKREYLRRLAG